MITRVKITYFPKQKNKNNKNGFGISFYDENAKSDRDPCIQLMGVRKDDYGLEEQILSSAAKKYFELEYYNNFLYPLYRALNATSACIFQKKTKKEGTPYLPGIALLSDETNLWLCGYEDEPILKLKWYYPADSKIVFSTWNFTKTQAPAIIQSEYQDMIQDKKNG